jgi:hypothetical protein
LESFSLIFAADLNDREPERLTGVCILPLPAFRVDLGFRRE